MLKEKVDENIISLSFNFMFNKMFVMFMIEIKENLEMKK